MKNIKILLAGPGTGKTTKVKDEVKKRLTENKNKKILVLSFTNATVRDLLSELGEIGVTTKNCMTLHSLAMKLNHLKEKHILDKDFEEKYFRDYAEELGIDFDQFCKFANCITFHQMITDCASFIKTNPAYVKEKLGEIDLLIVDEYQDFDPEERELVLTLSQYVNEVMVLGDDDQCIYGFKNADSEGIINLYNSCTRIEHENVCYRCPKDVVAAGNKLICKNKDRIAKEWKPHKDYDGLLTHQTSNQAETNQFVLEQVRKIKSENENTTIMLLSNRSYVVKPVLEHLSANNEEYVNWWKTKISLEDMRKIWWIKLIFSPNKLINIMFLLKSTRLLSKEIKENVKQILIKRFQHGESDGKTIEELIGLNVFEEELSGYVNKEPEIEEFFSNREEFSRFSKQIAASGATLNLEKLKDSIEVKVEFEKNKVNAMTIHKSKGLQADYVFILGMVEGILPNQLNSVDNLEAQRRLFFVGLSRAKKGLFLLSQVLWSAADLHKGMADINQFKHAGNKTMKGQTSLFITELT